MRWFSNSLQIRLVASLILGLILLSSSAILFPSFYIAQLLHENAKEKLALAAQGVAKQVIAWEEHNALALHNLSRQPAIISMAAHQQKPVLEAAVNTYHHLYLACTTDLEGMNVARSDDKGPKYYGDRFWFKNAAAGHALTRQVLVSRTTQQPAFCLSTPIRSALDHIKGVALQCTDLKKLAEEVGAVRLGKTGYAFVVDDTGKVLAHPLPKFSQELKELSEYPPVQAVLTKQTGANVFVDADQVTQWFYTLPLANGWGVVVLQSAQEVLSEVHFFWQIAIAVAVVTIILLSVVTWFIASRLISPITSLTKAVTALSDGHWQQPVSISQNDEIGQLAIAFNSMAQQLQSSYARLESYNRSLESKVVERTQTLSQALADLQATQQELIQSEKMAALGHLVAGIAHEINTPLGAIRSSAESMQVFLAEAFAQLPVFFQSLSTEHQQGFLTLLRLSQQEKHLTTREKRQVKKILQQQLQTQAIERPNEVADILTDIGIYEGIEPLIPLLKAPNNNVLLQMAYRLVSLHNSTYTVIVASERAGKVVFALKSFAHPEQSGEKVFAHVIEGIETVLTLYQSQLKQGVEVIKHYGELPPFLCYPNELSQVWTHLIHNALQAIANKGTLTLRAFTEENHIIVSVTDSGSGIDPAIQTKIFEPFFTTKPAGEGSGLGLDVVKRIVTKHQGHITVESRPGHTTFRVLLPCS